MQKKFLVINDDPQILKLYRKLNNPDMVVVECHTVEETLAAITEYHPEIIFLDHNLGPEKDEGLQVAKLVKDNVRIISITSDPAMAPEYEELGIEMLGSPFDKQKIDLIISQS